MTVIEQLQLYENDNLDSWLDLNDKEYNRFLKQLVKYAKEDLPGLKAYCSHIVPSEYSSLSIVYEAFTEYSTQFNEFLFEEIQRVVKIVITKCKE